MQAKSQQYQYLKLPNGQNIHYREQNHKSSDLTALVLIHGNFSSLGWWHQIIQQLKSTNKRIIALDQRGFGKSSYINKCHSLADWARDAIQFLGILNVQKAVVVGWSFGGTVAQKIAELAPQLVVKLILTCSVPFNGLVLADNDGKVCKTTEQILKIPKIALAVQMLDSKNTAGMRNVFQLLLYKKLQHLPQVRKQQLALDPFSQRCYPQLLTVLANSDIDVEKIKVPTLMIHGSDDAVIPVQTVISTAAKLGKLDIWEGYCHMIPLEDTKRYVDMINKFI